MMHYHMHNLIFFERWKVFPFSPIPFTPSHNGFRFHQKIALDGKKKYRVSSNCQGHFQKENRKPTPIRADRNVSKTINKSPTKNLWPQKSRPVKRRFHASSSSLISLTMGSLFHLLLWNTSLVVMLFILHPTPSPRYINRAELPICHIETRFLLFLFLLFKKDFFFHSFFCGHLSSLVGFSGGGGGRQACHI